MHAELRRMHGTETKAKPRYENEKPMTTYLLHQDLALLRAALLCIPTTSGFAATITVTQIANSGPGTARAALTNATSTNRKASDEIKARRNHSFSSLSGKG